MDYFDIFRKGGGFGAGKQEKGKKVSTTKEGKKIPRNEGKASRRLSLRGNIMQETMP